MHLINDFQGGEAPTSPVICKGELIISRNGGVATLETVSLCASRAHPGSLPSCFLALDYGQCHFISQMRVWLLSVSQGRISLQSYQHVAATHVFPLFQLLSSHWRVYYMDGQGIRKGARGSGGRKEA